MPTNIFEPVHITLMKGDQIYIEYLASPLPCPNRGKYYYLSGEFSTFGRLTMGTNWTVAMST